MVDTGCTQAVAGKQWMHDWAAQLEALGLKLTVKAQPECFTGLGGVVFDNLCMWTFPVALHCAHSTISFQEIEANMPGLIAKPDRFRWGIHLRFSDGTYDVVQLNRWG